MFVNCDEQAEMRGLTEMKDIRCTAPYKKALRALLSLMAIILMSCDKNRDISVTAGTIIGIDGFPSSGNPIVAMSIPSGTIRELVGKSEEYVWRALAFSAATNKLFCYDSKSRSIFQVEGAGNPPTLVYRLPEGLRALDDYFLSWLQVDDSGDHLYFLLGKTPRSGNHVLVELDLK